MAETIISNVFIITPEDSLLYDGDSDETVSVGIFTYLDVDYSYTAFKRGKTTCLHVYGALIDRNVYFKFVNHTFEPESDLDMATIFLEPPQDSVNNNDAVRGFTRETAPIMTGISELPSSTGNGIIMVHEDPLEYHVRLTEYTKTGAFETSNGRRLHYRALSSGGTTSIHGRSIERVQTKVIVLEASTGRKLYFTVNRSAFDEQLDMDTAQFLLRRVEGKQASFKPVVTEEEFTRLMDVYSSTDNSSLATTTISRPLSAPANRVTSSASDSSLMRKRPASALPSRATRGSFGNPSLPTISEQPSSVALPSVTPLPPGSVPVPATLASGGGGSSSFVMSIKAATAAATTADEESVWAGAPSSSEAMVVAKPNQTTTADKNKGHGKFDGAKVHDVHMLTNNREFEYVAATDGRVHAGSLIAADLLYLYRAFSRPATCTTYLTVFGVSSERTVRFRIPREQFVPEEDLKAATSFLEANGGGDDDDDDGSASDNPYMSLALTRRPAGRRTSAGGGAVAAGFLRCQVCKAPAVTSGSYDSRSRGLIGDQQHSVPVDTVDFSRFLANVDNDEVQQSSPPRPVLPIRSGVSNMGDIVVFEEPIKYHPVSHRTVVRGACTLDLGGPQSSSRDKKRDLVGTKNSNSSNNNSIVNNANNAANGTIACSYRATSSGGQTQVVVTDESSALRRKLYFTVERGTNTPITYH